MSGVTWYFALNNQQQGPISEDELRNLFTTGRLPPETLVWADGLSNWTAANQLPNFVPQAAPLPPAPVPPPTPVPPLAPNMVAAASAPMEQYAEEAAPQQQWSQEVALQQQNYGEQAGGISYGEHSQQPNQTSAPTNAEDYTAGGFQTTPEQFHFQQTGADAHAAENPSSENLAENLSAEEQSARLRNIVASTPVPGQSKWGNLDAIPTPKPSSGSSGSSTGTGGGGSFSAAELDAIGKSSSSSQHTPTAEADPTPLMRSGSVADSGRLRKVMDPESRGRGDTGSFSKGLATAAARGGNSSGTFPATMRLQISSDAVDLTTPHPWNRWWARCIDDSIYSLPMMLFIYIAGGVTPGDPGAGAVVAKISTTVAALLFGFIVKLILEAVVLGKFGTSIGKRSFNIHLKDAATGQPISMELAAKRTGWLTVFSGWLLQGIPFIGQLIGGGCCAWQYFELTGKGQSTWDAKTNIRYEHHPRDSKATTMLICAVVGIFIVHAIFGVMTMKRMMDTIMGAHISI
jgi:GYF domain 2/RDD family